MMCCRTRFARIGNFTSSAQNNHIKTLNRKIAIVYKRMQPNLLGMQTKNTTLYESIKRHTTEQDRFVYDRMRHIRESHNLMEPCEIFFLAR